MSSDETIEGTSRRLKQALLRKAFSENRGTATIADLNRRYLQRKALFTIRDEDIISQFETAAFSARKDREENRKLILECLDKTDFNREESPEIREMMMQDLAEQELTIDLLRVEGVPEDKLPRISMALARLNAYERLNAQASGEEGEWHEWSDNDPRIKYNRQRAHEILTGKKLNEQKTINLEVSEEEPSHDTAEKVDRKPQKFTLN